MRISDWSSDVCSSDLLHLRLKRAHRRHGGELLLRDREHQRTDDDGEQDDRDSEIAAHEEQPVEQSENGLFEPVEPAPVDRLVEVRDAQLFLIAFQHRHFLRAGEEAAGRGHRLRSEEQTSELQSLMRISYAVFFFTKTHKNT